MHRPRFQWNIGHGRSLALGERTLVMGIVNVTPDSFSDGGNFANAQQAIDHALRLFDEGADIVDLGAESTRPGSTLELAAQEEQQRLASVLAGILKARPDSILSADTYHAATARFAVEHGAAIINDVSGLTWDEQMARTCAELDCGLVLMHTRGKPNEWASQPRLSSHQVTPLVQQGLSGILDQARTAGISADRVVLDPGFGFGKRGHENLVLLNHLEQLHKLRRPLLIGLSRKGFLAPHAAPQERLSATIAASTVAILQGAHIIRVHDVREAVQAAQFADALLSQQSS